jgi:hypothetical protein
LYQSTDVLLSRKSNFGNAIRIFQEEIQMILKAGTRPETDASLKREVKQLRDDIGYLIKMIRRFLNVYIGHCKSLFFFLAGQLSHLSYPDPYLTYTEELLAKVRFSYTPSFSFPSHLIKTGCASN